MTARAAITAALALLATAAPAAAADPAWYDPQAGVPPSADLRAIAAGADGTLVAVGRDRASGAPVVFRRIAGTWSADDLAIAQGDLVSVALDGATAWAVGTTVVAGQRRALLLRLGAAGWQRVVAPSGMDSPRAVALAAGGGAIADAAGHVFPLHDGAPATAPLAPDPNGLAPPTGRPVDDLALSTADEGIAVDGGGTADTGFVRVSGGKVSQATATPSRTGLEAVGVATGAAGTVAIEGPGPCYQPATATQVPDLWRLAAPGIWQAETLPSATTTTRLCDVTDVAAATVIAGERDGHAVTWRLENGAATRTDLDAPPLRGVAAVAPDDVWAVGDGGTVLRYAVPPPPPPSQTPTDSGAGQQSGGSQGSTVVAQQSTTTTTTSSSEPPMQITVTESPGPKPVAPAGHTPRPPSTRHASKPAPRRLLSALKVRRSGTRLVLTFRLAAPARVIVRGRRGRRVVALARTRRLPAGRVRLLVRFRGHVPPTRLSIVVRPAEPRGQSSQRS